MAIEKTNMPKRSLKDLLDASEDHLPEDEIFSDNQESQNEDENVPNPDLCCECGDQPKDLECLNCDEVFCQVCFDYLHRTGKRRTHTVQYFKPITEVIKNEAKLEGEGENPSNHDDAQTMEESDANIEESMDYEEVKSVENDLDSLKKLKADSAHVPMRLNMQERKLLRLLDAALEVSEYTDKVDIYMYGSKAKRIVREIREICTVLTGLVVANGMDIGKVLVEGGDFAQHADWYRTVFEIGRRYKIMNPERMRSNYGKLAYIIMDSRLHEVKQVLDFDLYKPILTVYSHLESCNALDVLDDPQILVATMEIEPQNKSRSTVQLEIRRKERAIEALTKKYGEHVRDALYSLGDYHSYLEANKSPVDEMIRRLRTHFDTDTPDDYSLGISSGRHGARLNHSHKKQYQYVLQSLTLWSEIMGDMFLLWKLADNDLLDETHRYRLEDTGQGLNRVKASPLVSRAMHRIISRAQKLTGTWVGSSVVHLGDRAVPNALFFLDKYLQVPRILNPVNTTIRLIPQVLDSDKFAAEWVRNQFGSSEALIMTILTDFFRYAFDGSGADNFYDAGSCIDGRLTSAWNWANKLPKKNYYKQFLVTGFIGFNGSDGF